MSAPLCCPKHTKVENPMLASLDWPADVKKAGAQGVAVAGVEEEGA